MATIININKSTGTETITVDSSGNIINIDCSKITNINLECGTGGGEELYEPYEPHEPIDPYTYRPVWENNNYSSTIVEYFGARLEYPKTFVGILVNNNNGVTITDKKSIWTFSLSGSSNPDPIYIRHNDNIYRITWESFSVSSLEYYGEISINGFYAELVDEYVNTIIENDTYAHTEIWQADIYGAANLDGYSLGVVELQLRLRYIDAIELINRLTI